MERLPPRPPHLVLGQPQPGSPRAGDGDEGVPEAETPAPGAALSPGTQMACPYLGTKIINKPVRLVQNGFPKGGCLGRELHRSNRIP